MSSNNTNHNNSGSSGTVVCTPKPNSKLNKAEGYMAACQGGVLQVTMGVFFDGTGNNKENTDYQFKSKFDEDSSFYNSYSNVARAWKYYRGYLNGELVEDNTKINLNENDGGNLNIYVEGIGTNNRDYDNDIFGQALGIHIRSGVKARVRLGTEKAAEALMDYEKVKKVINSIHKVEVTFDVFGFSRGAAAARHFISLNTKTYPEDTGSNEYVGLTEKYSSYFEYNINQLFEGNQKIEVEIHWRFAGLYETVSSHGPADLLDFENDVKELGLKAISNAETVVQIVAEDEYRKNFSLTTIDSSPNHKVIKLPGVHSDIGGGYSQKYKSGNEENYKLYEIEYKITSSSSRNFAQQEITNVKKWFLDRGWYKEKGTNGDKLEIDETHADFYRTGIFNLKGIRRGIKNTYSLIPLHIMTKLAIENGVNFDGNKYEARFFDKYRVYDDIFLGSLLDTFNGSKLDLTSFTPFQLRQFRYEYLHWSSRLGTRGNAHDPRLKETYTFHPKFNRKIISG